MTSKSSPDALSAGATNANAEAPQPEAVAAPAPPERKRPGRKPAPRAVIPPPVAAPPLAEAGDLRGALKRFFGFDRFKGNQEAIIQSLIEGRDTFVLMPTGGGKSMCYQLPALLLEGTAIIISPLIALMKNQVDALRNISAADHIAHFLNSSLSKAAIDQVKTDIALGKTKLLYVAPESLTKEENVEFLRSVAISFYAIDEAHCISEWGHDFRPEYRRIRPIINHIGSRPVIALTATATPKVQHDIQKNLGMNDARLFKSSFNRANLYYEIRPKTANVDRDLIKFIKDNEGKSGIVYCLSRKKVEELAQMLQVNGIKARPYHAGMDPATRSANQDAFLMEDIDVIVATIAFGMGIDKPDVRFVIHYDMPKSLEGYYQETGRAGRDGGEGHCLTFYAGKDLQRMEKFMQGKPVNEQEIGKQLLQETASYAESRVCRRKSLLYYFGEAYDADNCGSCDNCVTPATRCEASDALRDALETIKALKENFRADYIIDIMLGKAGADAVSYEHDKLDVFGCQEKRNAVFLNAVIRQAIIAGYIDREIENYGLLKVTKAGDSFLKNPTSFTIVEDRNYDEEAPAGGEQVKSGASCAADPQLYGIIKDLRKNIARRLSLPTHIIFQDQSLEMMATTYPVTIDELKTLPGVGEGKAKRYGKEFVEVIARYVEENEIERLVDMRIYNTPNKSKQKIAIVQAIDRKIPLDEVARSKGLGMDELIEEIESIVYSGTRININYHLASTLDDDAIADIFEYFRESETDAISEALKEFGDEFTEEELRLVRIKFISDMGN